MDDMARQLEEMTKDRDRWKAHHAKVVEDKRQSRVKMRDHYEAENARFKEWYDKMFGSPCEEIRHQQIVEKLEDENAQLKANLAQAQAELNETWIDENQTVWNRPTAWAYAQTCKALHAKGDELQQAQAREQRVMECLRKGLGPFVDDPGGYEAWYAEATVLVEEAGT